MASVKESVLGRSVYVRIYGVDATKVEKRVFGEGFAKDGDETDLNTKVFFRYKSVEGKPVIEMEVAI